MVKERTLKVGGCSWRSDGYPGLRIGGKWFQDWGFDFDDYVRVVCEKTNLKIIKITGNEPEGETMTNKTSLILEREKDCKHSIRYLYKGSEPSPLVRTIYLDRIALGNPIPARMIITIEPASPGEMRK